MSADGELYIGEACRDTFEKELDEAFGKGKWSLDAKPFYDCWDMNIFPLRAEVLIEGDDGIIGKAIILSKPVVVEDIGGRHIELEPEGIEITKM